MWVSVPYRSIMLIRGETRPEAQAAAVTSVRIRHGKLLVFQWCWWWWWGEFRESMVLGRGCDDDDDDDGRGRMRFGGGAGFSPMDLGLDPAGRAGSGCNSRVIFYSILVRRI